MKKLILLRSVVVLTALTSQSAMADFKVRLGKANVGYEANVSAPTGSTNTSQTFQSNSFSATYIWSSGIYLDATHYWAKMDRSDGYQNAKFDPTFSLGYASETEGGTKTSMFVGVKHGNTEYVGTPVGGNTPNYSFDTNGFVMGGGLGFPMSFGGTIGANAGIGFMRMLWGETFTGSGGTTQSSATSSMSLGFSYGLTYTMPINETFGFALEYKGQSYNYKFDGSGTGTTKPTEVVEKVSTAGLSLYGQF